MIREIVKIDENLCDGCGLCVPNCHEGALQIIDGKARLISDLMCDGLGACLGHCPHGAITIEKREAAPYNEVEVVKDILPKGKNVMIAHLKHLRDHNENEFFRQAITWMEENRTSLPFDLNEVKAEVHKAFAAKPGASACGCPGSAEKTFNTPKMNFTANNAEVPSALTHWPVQMHLINPIANHFKGSDLVLAADCVAFSMGGFHSKLLKGKTLAIMCPKLDHNLNVYVEKIVSLIDDAQVNTITVVMMEVPCCGGMLRFVKEVQSIAKRKVPVKAMIVSVSGEVLTEEWV
ncbi:MAG: 4Fe-4S binding protein [Bacteroidales bacterium]|nr:4Fe-4S binding protein [Bacteroidales bacterium]